MTTDTKHSFIEENILSVLHLDSLPESQQAELLDQMTEVIEQRLLVRVFDSLNVEQQKQFDHILQSGSDEELKAFLGLNVPSFLDLIQDEVVALKERMQTFIQGQTGE